ncbi:MAG: ComEC/Rec2 family competence protein, partial [Gemmataceae bacterium]
MVETRALQNEEVFAEDSRILNAFGFRKISQAPLVWIAVPFTCGIVIDSYLSLPIQAFLPLATAGLVLLFFGSRLASRRSQNSSNWSQIDAKGANVWVTGNVVVLVGMCLAVGSLAPAYHRWLGGPSPKGSIADFMDPDGQLVRVRGILESDWESVRSSGGPFVNLKERTHFRSFLRLTRVFQGRRWVRAEGRVVLKMYNTPGSGQGGDELELVGWLAPLGGPGNPGGRVEVGTPAVVGTLKVDSGVGASQVHQPARYSWFNWGSWVRWVRAQVRGTIETRLPSEQQGLARALLLGDQRALNSSEWEKYRRTGVVHVLTISGQHVTILSLFLVLGGRLLEFRQRHVVVFLLVFALVYCVLTGARPPIRRATFMVLCFCGSYLLGRVPSLPNAFAGAWLGVWLVDPPDIFRTGCQLSFLSVAVLLSSSSLLGNGAKTREQLRAEEEESFTKGVLKKLRRWVFQVHVLGGMVWLGIAPLIASKYHLVSLSGPVIGPLVSCFIALALLCGFFLFLCEATFWFLAPLFGWLTSWMLSGATYVVDCAHGMPFAYGYVVGFPDWWLWGYYPLLGVFFATWRLRGTRLTVLSVVFLWVIVGLSTSPRSYSPDALQVTFLDVG